MSPRDPKRFSGKRGLTLILACILLAAVLYSVFGEMGLVATVKMHRTHRQILQENERLTAEIERLRREIANLTTTSAAVEEIARRDLGLMGKKEGVILLEPKTGSAPPAAAGGGRERRR